VRVATSTVVASILHAFPISYRYALSAGTFSLLYQSQAVARGGKVSIARSKNMLEAQFDVRVNKGVIRYALVNFLDYSYVPVEHKKKGMDPKR
jgi:hypothetical protein